MKTEGDCTESVAFIYAEALWLLFQHLEVFRFASMRMAFNSTSGLTNFFDSFALPADRVDAASGTRHHPSR